MRFSDDDSVDGSDLGRIFHKLFCKRCLSCKLQTGIAYKHRKNSEERKPASFSRAVFDYVWDNAARTRRTRRGREREIEIE